MIKNQFYSLKNVLISIIERSRLSLSLEWTNNSQNIALIQLQYRLQQINDSQFIQTNSNIQRIQMNDPRLYGNNDLRKKIEDYSYGLKDIIGRGFSSVVYRGLNQKNKQKVAIKVIDIRSIQGKPEKKMLDGEIDALRKLNHSNLLKCYDIINTANNCYIITEFCNEGDLQNLLKKRGKLSEDEAISFIRQIIMGFTSIAEAGFLHRDLKPANILIKDKMIKIADFGFAKRMTSNPKETVNVGTPLYMSPQALQSNIYTAKNDIWSIGVIIYQILHGKIPWTCSNQKELVEEINKNNISFSKSISEDLKDFVKKCLTVDDKKRISIKEIGIHPFINRITDDGLPQLLRKPTSFNQNVDLIQIGSTKQMKSLQTDQTQNYGSNTNKPKILHHRANGSSSHQTQKQVQSQINWMKFLFKFSQMFPKIEDQDRYTFGLRFIVLKQMFCQLSGLEQSLDGDNIFNFQGWVEFMNQYTEKDKYSKELLQFKKKYEDSKKQLKKWIPFVSKDKKISSIVDENFQHSQLLSIFGLSYSLQYCKNLWKQLQKKASVLTDEDNNDKFSEQALRLDFAITYYQLNCFLIDNFTDPEYFCRMSKLQTIIELSPGQLLPSHLKDIERKLTALQICK